MDRFGTFREEARRFLEYALANAEEQGDPKVGLRHLLIGLASVEQGTAGPIRGSGFDARRLRVEIPGSRRTTPTVLSLSTRNAIERTISEAERWPRAQVSAAHLILSILTADEDEARVTLAEGGGHLQAAIEIAEAQTKP